jgi:hypothetical protein
LEKRAKQVLLGNEGVGGEKEWAGDKGEKWPKQCMHIAINE